MSTTSNENGSPAASSGADEGEWRAPVERVARLFVRGEHGHASLPTSISAAARRIDVARPARAAAILVPILESAAVDCARLTDQGLLRWATVVRAVAVLSGTSGSPVCRRQRPAGRAIAACGYSEARFARLMTARGQPLSDQVIRLARYLAAGGAVPLDMRPIADLVLEDGNPNGLADRARLRLARAYFSGPGQGEVRTIEPAPAG